MTTFDLLLLLFYPKTNLFMGDFRIIVHAVGGHGVDRDKKHGEAVDFNEGGPQSPDAIAKRFVDELKASGASISEATITHWPNSDTRVVDDLQTGKRTGNF